MILNSLVYYNLPIRIKIVYKMEFENVVKELSGNDVVGYVSGVCEQKEVDLPLLLASLVLEKRSNVGQIMMAKSSDLSTMLAFNSARVTQDSKSVGYSTVKSESFSSKTLKGDKYNTPLVYISKESLNGKILQMINGDAESLFWCNILIIDDAYADDIETKMTIYLWKECYNTGKPVPRLLLMSSHEDVCEMLPEYPQVVYKREKCAEVTYTGSTKSPSDPSRYEDLAKIIASFHLNNPLEPDQEDIWLVFLPSIREIIKVSEHLTKFIKILPNGVINSNIGETRRKDIKDNVEIVKFWDETRSSDAKMFKNREIRGVRRIVLSTSIGENYCFSPDAVFDSMTYTREDSFSPIFISKEQAELRANHASSVVVRHVSKDKYGKLLEGMKKGTRFENLAKVSIYLLSSGLDYNNFLREVGVPEETIARNDQDLIKNGISTYDVVEKRYKIGKNGEFIFHSGLNVPEGLVLYNLLTSKSQAKNLVQIVAFSVLLEYPVVGRLVENSVKLPEGYSNNDVILNLHILLTIMASEGGTGDARGLCKKFGVDHSKYMEAKGRIFNLVDVLNAKYKSTIARGVTKDISVNYAPMLPDFDRVVGKYYKKLTGVTERPGFYAMGKNMVKWMPRVPVSGTFPKDIYKLGLSLMKDKNGNVQRVVNYSYVRKMP